MVVFYVIFFQMLLFDLFYSNNQRSMEFHFLQVVERLCNLKPIEMRDDGGAEFELEMSLKDSSSKIFLFKVRFILIITPLSDIDDVK